MSLPLSFARSIGIILYLLLCGGGATWLVLPLFGADEKNPPAKVDEETLKQKLKERNEVLKELVKWWSLQHHELAGNNNHIDHPDTLEYLLDAHRLALGAALELAEEQADRIALHQGNVETLKDEEKRTDALVKAGKPVP